LRPEYIHTHSVQGHATAPAGTIALPAGVALEDEPLSDANNRRILKGHVKLRLEHVKLSSRRIKYLVELKEIAGVVQWQNISFPKRWCLF
jgi:hypothetical protein